jgi:hypothetical protein
LIIFTQKILHSPLPRVVLIFAIQIGITIVIVIVIVNVITLKHKFHTIFARENHTANSFCIKITAIKVMKNFNVSEIATKM